MHLHYRFYVSARVMKTYFCPKTCLVPFVLLANSLIQIRVSFVFILLDRTDFPWLCSTLVGEWRRGTVCLHKVAYFMVEQTPKKREPFTMLLSHTLNVYIPLATVINDVVDYCEGLCLFIIDSWEKIIRDKKACRFRLKGMVLFWTLELYAELTG